MDRREIVEVFRERLGEVIDRSGLSRSAFAGEIGHDRSTLSQLLSPEHVRLPRAETIAAIAEIRNTRKWIVDYAVRAHGNTSGNTSGGTNGGIAAHRKGEFGRRECWRI